jgi:hypothetical protein
MSDGGRDFAGGDAGAVLMTVIGLVGLATFSLPMLLLPFGVALGVRQIRRHRRTERALRAEQRDRLPADWMDRLSDHREPGSGA